MNNRTLLISIIALLWLAGCGQKGDLYRTTDAPPPKVENTSGQ